MTTDLTTLARQHWAKNYRMDIRAVVRSLWSGVLDYFQAWEQMDMAIRRGLRFAWQDGSEECGIKPSEYTPEEKHALESAINSEMGYIDGFLTAIEENSKEAGGKLEPLMGRADLWITRYLDIRHQAMVMACANRPMVWRLGPTKDHCRDCLRYDGRVYRAKTWEKWGAMPQSRSLECGGYRCKCTLELTDEPCVPGHPPRPSGGS